MPVFVLVPAGLAVSLQLLHGDLEQIQKEYMRLFTRNVSITRRLGFSDIIMPGEIKAFWKYHVNSIIFFPDFSLNSDVIKYFVVIQCRALSRSSILMFPLCLPKIAFTIFL